MTTPTPTHGSLAREIIANNQELFKYLKPDSRSKGFHYEHHNITLDKPGLSEGQILNYIYNELAQKNMDNSSVCNGVLKAIRALLAHSVDDSWVRDVNKYPAPDGYKFYR